MSIYKNKFLPCLLLFLNGAFALAFELIWCKRLEQLSGVGLFAVTMTVSCFMLGLALGGFFGAQLCSLNIFQKRSTSFLVLLQAAATAACLFFSVFIFGNAPYWIIGTAGSAVWQAVTLLLIIPALGIGILLPAAAACFAESQDEQQRSAQPATSVLYSCNLFGSLAGGALTAFWFMPTAGLWHSALIAVVISLAALCISLQLAVLLPPVASIKSAVQTPATQAIGTLTSAIPSVETWPVVRCAGELFAYIRFLAKSLRRTGTQTSTIPLMYGTLLVCISGFVGMALEIMCVRIAALLFGAGVYSLALVLICYLLSSAAGAWAACRFNFSHLYDSKYDSRTSSYHGSSALLILGPLLAAAYLYWELFFLNQSPWYYLLIYRALCASGKFAAHILTCSLALLALEFVPIFILSAFFVAVLKRTQKPADLGYLICANSTGCIAGTWITGFLLIPILSTMWGSGIQKSIVVLAGILCLLSLCSLYCTGKVTRIMRIAAASVAAFLLTLPAYCLPPWNASLLSLNIPGLCRNTPGLINKLSSYSDCEQLAHRNQLDFYREGLNSTVSVFSNAQHNMRYLKTDGLNQGAVPINCNMPVAPTALTDLSTHLLLAELPLLAAPAHKLNVCLIGYGTGTTVGALLCDPQIQHMHIIELERCVIEASQFFSDPHTTMSAAQEVNNIFIARTVSSLQPVSVQMKKSMGRSGCRKNRPSATRMNRLRKVSARRHARRARTEQWARRRRRMKPPERLQTTFLCTPKPPNSSDLSLKNKSARTIKLHIEDARSYLLNTRDSNDIIICQPSEPWVGGAANLFTREYWQLCRRRLAPGGILCQWIQLYGLSPQLLADLCRSFISVFPNTAVIHEPGAGEIFLLASNSPPTTDIAKLFLQRCTKLNQPNKFRSLLMFTPAQLQNWCATTARRSGDNRIVTDDNMLIEYAMPHNEKNPEACISTNLTSLK